MSEVFDTHPFKVGDVLLDATGEASFVEGAFNKAGPTRRVTQSGHDKGFESLVFPVTILARFGAPIGLIVERKISQVLTVEHTSQYVVSRCE